MKVIRNSINLIKEDIVSVGNMLVEKVGKACWRLVPANISKETV